MHVCEMEWEQYLITGLWNVSSFMSYIYIYIYIYVKTGGRRSRGRPRKTWLEDLEDLRMIGIRVWWRNSQRMGNNRQAYMVCNFNAHGDNDTYITEMAMGKTEIYLRCP